jgi:hypothetical protein
MLDNSCMNLNFESRMVGTLGFHAGGNFTALREFDCITLKIPLRANLSAEPSSTWLCQDIHVQLYGVMAGGVDRLICEGPVCTVLRSNPGEYSTEPEVSLRCSPNSIAEYERARNGGPVFLRLKIRAKMHPLINVSDQRKVLGEPRYLFEQEDFRADKEKWIAALRSAGLSVSLLIEIPFPLTGEVEDEDLKAIAAAFSSFENGGSVAWKDSIGHLRPLLEKWAKASPKPTAEPKDGSPNDRDWKLLNLRDALYKLCHFWVHESAPQCNRDDALLMLSSVAALLRTHN